MEVGALLGETWSGIPTLVAALAEEALGDATIDWAFMIDTIALPRLLLEHSLVRRSGVEMGSALTTLAWERREITRASGGCGLFTNIKTARGLFAREAMLIHDLSPLLLPEFHDERVIAYFAEHIRGDVETSDHLFCVSRATQGDVEAYLGVPAERTSLIEPGVAFDPVALSAAQLRPHGLACEPYVAIVGTLEPRKNGRLMLEHLARDPRFAARYRVVFIGADGWLDEKARLLDALDPARIGRDRVVFTGFLPEADKIALILNAAFCIYPSLFEGYGLPVLEAAALGRLTVCSDSASLPEVAPHACLFFDADDSDSFAEALDRAEALLPGASPSAALGDLIARAARVSPARCYAPIARWVRDR